MPPGLMKGWVGAIITALVAIAYLWPSFVAIAQRQRRPGLIFALNLFLGWTVIGWIVAYRLASRTEFEEDRRPKRRRRRR